MKTDIEHHDVTIFTERRRGFPINININQSLYSCNIMFHINIYIYTWHGTVFGFDSSTVNYDYRGWFDFFPLNYNLVNSIGCCCHCEK